LPSARVLEVMAREFDNSFVRFARAQSLETRATLLNLPFPAASQARFRAMAQQSVEDQKKIEAADTVPFDTYLQQYLSPERLGLPAAPPRAA